MPCRNSVRAHSLAAKNSAFSLCLPNPHADTPTHTYAHSLVPTQEKSFLFFCVVFHFLFFFLKRTYPNIWIINHLRFLRNWVFLSLVVLVFFFFEPY